MKYKVGLTVDVYMSTDVVVEAPSREEAEAIALEMAIRDEVDWRDDEINPEAIEVTGSEEIAEKPRELRLTNGTETFSLGSIVEDANGPAHGKDSTGAGYSRCDLGCTHEHVPTGATVWHDDNEDDLWQLES